jgi:hypothetical protein
MTLIKKKGDNWYVNGIKMNVFEEIVKMSAGADDGWGKAYYHVIPKIINDCNYKIVAEIGVAYGGHSEAILKNTNVERLYSIDPYSLEHDNTDGYTLPNGINFTQKEYEELNGFAQTRVKKAGGDRSVFMRYSGHAAFSYFHKYNIKLDLVFIDARHRYEDLYTDIYLYKSLIRDGGIISGHDYGHESYPGIKLAVDEWFPSTTKTVHVEDGNVWWVKL